MAKKINHRGRGGHRELLFSLCPLCSLWFFKRYRKKGLLILCESEIPAFFHIREEATVSSHRICQNRKSSM